MKGIEDHTKSFKGHHRNYKAFAKDEKYLPHWASHKNIVLENVFAYGSFTNPTPSN